MLVNDDTIFYRAPELLRTSPLPRTRILRVSKNDQARYKDHYRIGDIYSLGIIMYEVLFRQAPFWDSTLSKKGLRIFQHFL